MIKSKSVVHGTVRRIDRIKNTMNGNARFWVTFQDGRTWQNAPDSAVAYHIRNLKGGEVVDLALDRSNKIIDLEVKP